MAKTNNRLVRSLVEAARASGYSHGWSDRADRAVTRHVETREALEALLKAITSKYPRPLSWSGEPDQLHALYAAIDAAKEVVAAPMPNRRRSLSGSALVRKLAKQTESDWGIAPNTMSPAQMVGGHMTTAQVLGLPRTRRGTIIIGCYNGTSTNLRDRAWKFPRAASMTSNRFVVQRVESDGQAYTTIGSLHKSWIVVGQIPESELTPANITRVRQGGGLEFMNVHPSYETPV